MFPEIVYNSNMATNLQNPTTASAAKTTGSKMDRYVSHQLKKTTQQVRVSDMVAGALALAAYVLGFFFVVALIDAWIWPLTPTARLIALAAFLIGGFAIAWFMLLPFLFRKVNPQYAAKMIEEAKPEFKNSLLNYLSIRRDKKSTHRAILNEVSKQAAVDLSTITPDATVDKSNVIRAGFILVGLVAATVAYAIFSPKSPLPSVMRVLAPGAKISRPAAVRIHEVAPGDTSVFFGDRPQVVAKIYGKINDQEVRLIYSTEDSQIVDASILMEKTGANGTYEAVLSPGPSGIQQPISYRVEAGDGVSPTYSIDVRTNPSVSIESVKVTPPKYTGLPERLVEGNGEIQAVEGSHVEITARANLPIEIAYIVPLVAKSDAAENSEYRELRTIQMGPKIDSQDTVIGRLVAALNANRDKQQFTHYKINFRSTDNFRNERPNVYPIRVIADLEPEVEIIEPAQTELTIAVNQPLPVEVWAADLDYEISSIDLHIDHQGNRILDQNLVKNPKGKVAGERVSVRHAVTPADLRLQPGDTAIMFATASDNRISPTSELADPNVSRTPNYTLVITDPVRNPQQPNENQDGTGQETEQDDSRQQETGDRSSGQQQGSEQQPGDEQQQAGSEESWDNSGDQEQSEQSEQSDASSGGGSEQQGGGSGEQQSSSQDGSGSQAQDSGAGGKSSQPNGAEESPEGAGSETGNSTGDQSSDSGSRGQQQGSGSEGEFENSDNGQESGGNASSNGGTDNGGNSNDPASSGGRQGANQDGGGGDQQQFRDNSLTDGEQQPLRENASDSEQFERLQELLENQDNQSASGDESGGGDQRSDNNSGNQKEDGSEGTGERSERPRNPGDSQQLDSDPGNQSGTEPGDSDSQRSGGNQEEQQSPKAQPGSNERAADGNPEQPASNGAESQNGTPDETQGGSGSESRPDAQGDSSAASGESGSPDAESSPGEGSESGAAGDPAAGSESESSPSGEGSEAASGSGDESQSDSQPGSPSASSQQSSSGTSSNQDSEGAESNGSGGDSENQGNSEAGSSSSDSQPGQKSSGKSGSSEGSTGDGESASAGDEAGDLSDSESNDNRTPNKAGGVGGSADQNSGNDDSPELPSQPDQPNLDYAKKVTDLVLNRLEDQQYEPDPDLLEQMNWTKEDLARFLKRWQQMRDKAGAGDFQSKREYEEGLRSLGLSPKASGRGRVAEGVKDKEFRLNESGVVDQVPAEYRERFNSFLMRRNRSKRDAAGRHR